MKNRKTALLQDRSKLTQLTALRSTRKQIASRELTTHNVVLEEKQEQLSSARSSLDECELQLSNAEGEYRKRLQSGEARVRELQELSRFVSARQERCSLARAHWALADSQWHEALEFQTKLMQRLKAADVRHSQALEMTKNSRALRDQMADSRRESEGALTASPKVGSSFFTSK